ncbi:MFS transporter [Salinibacterium sp. ZJ454]|uniref:MFS transporter n=1 Tax=Salinibacterium sp. ZJ454 TaxID=2708339 RepID=UPI001FBA3100|nr:MFS transporter [Salinibacterium sp. ZJ454]
MPADLPTPTTTRRAPGLFSRGYLWITIGSCALVFLGAFESLAVTTVMPVVSADLDGASLYALAFAGPFATAVIGMVVAGNWSDRSGPVAPLYTSSALFALGLLIAGTATAMPVLVAGRLVQGLGTGAVTVALYVVIARIYPPRLHPAIFAGFAAAWVIPSLIGPFIAGVVTEWLSWHWVFLGVVGLVVIATIMVGPAMRSVASTNAEGPKTPWAVGRIVWAVVAAAAVLALNLVAAVPRIGGWLSLATVIVALIALRPLVPRGTLTARRRLPSVVLLRGLAAASFFGAEVYLPYLLIDQYDFSPSLAGLALTSGALAWAATSWLQGRMGDALSNRAATTIGTVLVLAAILLAFATALLGWSPSVAIAGWLLGGGGMGLMYPRISVMTLAMSTEQNQGFNSAAMSISDSLGSALALAVTGLVFAAFGFPGVFAFAAVIAAAAIVVAPRVAARR